MMTRTTAALAGLFTVILLGACSSNQTIEAHTDFNQAFDFSAVRTIGVLPPARPAEGQVSISDMQVDRISDALSDELSARGYEIIDDYEKADLQLTWHLVLQQRTDVRAYNSASYYNCWRCGPGVSDVSIREYTEGTFIVDLIDPVRDRSVWRAVVQSRLKSKPDPSGSSERRAEAARAIFAEFPPG
jgi:hypothetical protein